ncbi:MAG TPA: M1 family metallopeptidase [Actinophytocola sp.]|uniref:M1 family metallopeptidase n=1 Tax=Actinophytocola sp. TaxID=1872138 RepID=UPI002DDCEB1C|nr:M1 family metallopeptidase [Actinophytocola sp.]HEV2783268.1 M1 family metallopeptidase [Actinophytocola sp.]
MPVARSRVAPVRLACLALAATAFTACSGEPADEPGPTSGAAPPTSRAVPQAAAGADGAGDPYYPTDGNGGYDVTDYHVSISYDPPAKRLDGDTVITATATGDLTRFNLDLKGFEVSAVEVDDKPATFERAGDHELVITPATAVPTGRTFRTRVRYGGVPGATEDSGLGANGWQIAKSGGAFAAGEPHSATSWYPANDTPRDKATFKLTARVPDGWSVISNGREEPSTSDGGWTTYTWVEKTRIATYLTTIGIDKWTFERSTLPGGIPVVSAYAPGAEGKKQVEARLPEIIEFLSQKFGPYPQSAAGGIYINESIGFSLETQTRPIYANWAETAVVVHENAHQWYGDSVTITSWGDMCLNECWASYAQWLWDEAKEGKDLDAEYRTQVARASNRLWTGKLFDMGAGKEFTAVYTKGPLALHALRRQIGEDAFNRVMREWPARHRDGNASWPEFETFVQEIAGQDLRAFFEAWFRSDRKPADEYLYPGGLRR